MSKPQPPKAPGTSAVRPKRNYGARAVGSYIPPLTQKAFEAYGFALATLITDWSAIVGTALAGCTAPERLKWARGPRDAEPDADDARQQGAVLHLRVDPARALEVQYKSSQIIARINTYFGYAAVSQVRLVQAQVAKPAAPPARRMVPPVQLPDVGDAELRGALERLATGLKSRPDK
jgi:hypothetical protein